MLATYRYSTDVLNYCCGNWECCGHNWLYMTKGLSCVVIWLAWAVKESESRLREWMSSSHPPASKRMGGRVVLVD